MENIPDDNEMAVRLAALKGQPTVSDIARTGRQFNRVVAIRRIDQVIFFSIQLGRIYRIPSDKSTRQHNT